MDKKVYSMDEERYYDRDSIEDMLEDNSEVVIIYEATPILFKHSDFFSIESLIEDMQHQAYEQSEFADGYLEGIETQKEELKALILDYMDKHVPQPTFYTVNNVKEITREEFIKEQ